MNPDELLTHAGPEVRQLIDELELPGVVERVRERSGGAEQFVPALVSAVRQDPDLCRCTLELLKATESETDQSCTAFEDVLDSLEAAELYSLTIAASLIHGVWTTYDDFDREHLWGHSIRCGVYASALIDGRTGISPWGALALGVLHDIGRTIILHACPTSYREVCERARNDRVYLWKAERAVLGFDHAELGAVISESWGLPDAYCNAIRFHHLPDLADQEHRLAALVALADSISHACHPEDLWKDDAQPIHRGLWTVLGLEESQVRSIMDRRNAVRESTEVFLGSLATPIESPTATAGSGE